MKNRTLRISLILAILTLVTSCFMGSTFAKYVTTDSGSDSARVAYWGVKVTAGGFGETSNGFYTEYAKDDDSFTLAANSVVSNTTGSTANLVAPGTKGAFGAIVVSGTPEVAVKVTYASTVTVSGWAVAGDDFYCPLEITVTYKGAVETFDCEEFADAAAMKTAIEAHINALNSYYAANTDLSEVTDDLSITWEWDFYVDDATDVKDTALGNAAADGNESTIAIEVGCTVTQVD